MTLLRNILAPLTASNQAILSVAQQFTHSWVIGLILLASLSHLFFTPFLILVKRPLARRLLETAVVIVVYLMITGWPAINGQSISYVSDLKKPDALLFGLNLFPLVAAALAMFRTFAVRKSNFKDKVTISIIDLALVALFYRAPAAFGIFWIFYEFLAGIFEMLAKSEAGWARHTRDVISRFAINSTSRGFVQSVLFLGLLAFLYAFVLPTVIISYNYDEFIGSNSFALIKAGCFYFVVIMISGLWFCRASISTYVYLAILIWSALSGVVFPLVKSGGMMDLASAHTNFLNSLICFIFTVFLTWQYFRDEKFAKFLSITVAVLTLFSFGHGAWVINRLNDKQGAVLLENAGKIDGSKHNVFVVSFDGLPGNIFSKVLNDSPELAHEFRDFVFFPEVISTSPATIASLMSELYGVRQYKQYGESVEEMVQELKNRGEKNLLDFYKANGYSTYTYGPYAIIDAARSTTRLINRPTINAGSTSELHLISFARTLSPSVFRRIVSRLRMLTEAATASSHLEANERAHFGPDWDREGALYGSENYDRWVHHLNSSLAPRSAFFMHFVHTHFPVDFDQDCNYRSDNQLWHQSNQNEVGLFNQTTCAAKQFAIFVKQMKKIDAYDNATIIFKSDHGEPATYYEAGLHSVKINGHSSWGYNRYRPTLLIKMPHKNRDSLLRQDVQVTTSDLAFTLCNSERFDGCASFQGVDLMSDTLPSAYAGRKIYIYLPKDQSSDFKIETHKEVGIYQDKLLLDALKYTKNI